MTAMSTTRHSTPRRQFWLEHIEACTAGGGSIKAYAEVHGLSVASLYAAKSRYAPLRSSSKEVGPVRDGGRQGGRFVRVTPAMTLHTKRVACRAHLANGTLVEMDVDISELEGALHAFAALG